jgi:uncharacterized protein
VRVFLDTNVLVSAFTARGLCEDLYRYLLACHDIMTGEVNLQGLQRILTTRFQASAALVELVESQLRDQIVVPRPQAPSALEIRDPDDRWVLASVEAGDADMLVTGDRDLLVVAEKSTVPILTPRAAWERLRRAN